MSHSLTILLADDDLDDASVFEEVLAEIDRTVAFIHKKDGQETLNYLLQAEQFPSVVFLDLNMPRMNGKDCLRSIKENPVLSILPVVMYTTSSQSKDIQEAIISGASGFITKPSSINELKRILSSIVTGLPNDLLKTLRGLSNNSSTFIVSS